MDQKTLIPVSIVVAGLFIAGAVFYSNRQPNSTDFNFRTLRITTQPVSVPEDGSISININPVTDEDWVRGNLDAQIKLVEYSDTECPFCKRLHETMNEIVTEYDGSEVAWVYRHLPLSQLHSKAGIESVATECAGDLAGQDGFWNFTNRLYSETPSNNQLDLDQLLVIAEDVNLDLDDFKSCLSEDKFDAVVLADAQDAVNSAAHLGGRIGTPYTVMVSKTELNTEALSVLGSIADQYNSASQTIVTISDDKKRATLSGALPKEMFTSILDAALGEDDDQI